MKQRIVVLLTVVALMVAMMLVMAAPAFARQNCTTDPVTGVTVCSGGVGFGNNPEAFSGGGHRIENLNTGDLFFAGGFGHRGGGVGGLCTGNEAAGDVVCTGTIT